MWLLIEIPFWLEMWPSASINPAKKYPSSDSVRGFEWTLWQRLYVYEFENIKKFCFIKMVCFCTVIISESLVPKYVYNLNRDFKNLSVFYTKSKWAPFPINTAVPIQIIQFWHSLFAFSSAFMALAHLTNSPHNTKTDSAWYYEP